MGEIKGLARFMCAICLLHFASCQEADITERILPEIKRLGTQGRLECVVINQLDNSCYWIQKGTGMELSRDETIIIDEIHNPIVNGWPKFQVEKEEMGEKNKYTLIISRLEPRDAGWYTCQVQVRGDNRHPTMDGELVVLYAPSMVLSQTTNTVSVKQGDAVNMTCEATGYPSPNITWVRVSGAPLPNGKLRHIGKVYPIEEVDTRHRGIYRCLADNAVIPTAVHDATLLVLFTPFAKAIQSSYGQAENRMFDVTIECRVAGWPDPDLQWYKVLQGGVWDPINNDDKHTVNILLNHANILGTNERWFQMVIRAVQANDFGDYICEGKNSLGNGYDTINLFATSECQGPNCPPEMSTPGTASTQMSTLWTLLSTVILSLHFV